MKRSLLLTAAILGLLFTACKKSSNSYNSTSTYHPQVGYELLVTNATYSVAPAPPAISSNLQWTSGFAYPDVITFQAQQNNLQVQFKSTSTAQIDLMAPLAVEFGNFTLPAGFYNQISLKIDLDRAGSNPIMQLNGRFTNDAVSIPVMLQITNSILLQTELDSITITNDSSYVAITAIDLSTVTAGITGTMLLNAQLSNGTIVISSTSNQNLYSMVLENLESEHHHCDFEHHHDHE